jgi:hypothetical protein
MVQIMPCANTLRHQHTQHTQQRQAGIRPSQWVDIWFLHTTTTTGIEDKSIGAHAHWRALVAPCCLPVTTETTHLFWLYAQVEVALPRVAHATCAYRKPSIKGLLLHHNL